MTDKTLAERLCITNSTKEELVAVSFYTFIMISLMWVPPLFFYYRWLISNGVQKTDDFIAPIIVFVALPINIVISMFVFAVMWYAVRAYKENQGL